MKNNIIKYIALIGLIGLLYNCEKDETKVEMLENPAAPTLKTLPDLTLLRANGSNILKFIGTPVDPGFNASATYFLEACAAGNDFDDSLVIYSGVQDTAIKISVSDLNSALLKKFPADQVSSIDFRIRCVLVVDAGTGALGTSSKPMVYKSTSKTSDVTIYGLPRLDLIGSGIDQKIESALGDGKYSGFVKLDKTKAFTLKDPDANIIYGADGATSIAKNGTDISPSDNGWFKLAVDTVALTYKMDAYMIGLVGSATVNGWGSPDQKMDYDAKTDTWSITTNLIDGEIKFRLNDGWAWNLGGTKDKLEHNGSNIPVSAGNYTITLTITNATQGSEAGTFTIVKNN